MHSVNLLHKALHEFYTVSGLQPNKEKSSVFIASRHPRFLEDISSLFQFQVGELSIRYLGVPLISTKLNTSHCKPLVDRITARAAS